MKKIIIIIVGILLLIGVSIFIISKMNKKEEVEETNQVIEETDTIKLVFEDKELVVKLEKNLTTDALVEKLNGGSIEISAQDYGNFEKVGNLPFKLPRSDKYIKTESGDVILYNGNQICIYYDTNTWNFTRIGKITNVSGEELKEILGEGDITYKITK